MTDLGPRLLPPPDGAARYVSVTSLRAMHLSDVGQIRETITRHLESAVALDARTHALTSIFAEGALQAAEDLLARIGSGQVDPSGCALLGVPVLVKENIAVVGAPLRCGSRILEGYVCPFDATVTARLRRAGAIPVGYTNMDEFAMGSSCEHSCHGPTLNPYDLSRVPGGSSGGGAAAAAWGITAIGLGSDTGGSVRQPASYCNVFGFKPSYGAVSRYGLVAFASSLDQIGPFARSMDDLRQIFAVIAGFDERDATSYRPSSGGAAADRPSTERQALSSCHGVHVAVPRGLIRKIADPEVWQAFCQFEEGLRQAGCKLDDVPMPDVEAALPTYYILSSAEASSNLARFDGLKFGRRVEAAQREEAVREARSQGFGSEVKRRIMLGTFALSSGYYEAYYGRAMAARRQLREAYDRIFARYDVILSPTTPTVAFALGSHATDPTKMYANDVLTIPPSLAGLPALSVPVGGAGLPVGMQLVAPLRCDQRLLDLGTQLEARGLCGVAGIAPRASDGVAHRIADGAAGGPR